MIEYGEELTLYVLQRKDNGEIVFKILNDETGKFESPRSIKQNKIQYFLFDIPEDEKAPAGYTRKEVQIKDFDVFCFVPDDAEHADFCYVRALAEGKTGYYSFDTAQGSIQRSVDLEAASDADEKIKKMEEEYAEKQAGLAKKEKLQKYLLLAAGIIILALIIVLIIVAVKKGKGVKKKNKEVFDERAPAEDDLPDETEETEGIETFEFDIENLVNDIEEDSWKKLGFKDHDDKI